MYEIYSILGYAIFKYGIYTYSISIRHSILLIELSIDIYITSQTCKP